MRSEKDNKEIEKLETEVMKAKLEKILLDRDLMRIKLAKESMISVDIKSQAKNKDENKKDNSTFFAFVVMFIVSAIWAMFERSKGIEISDQIIFSVVSLIGVVFNSRWSKKD